MKRIIFIIFCVIMVETGFAHTGGNVKYTCPLCATRFESYTQFSGTSFGQNLDLRSYGAIMVPAPIPKCPKCHFVFADDLFTKEEIITLKARFKKNNIFEMDPNMPNYYYLAREGEIVQRDLRNLVWWFLSAVWENEDETLKNKLINITIEYINKLNEADEVYNNYQMVKLDLLRRSGQFDDALQIIEKIKMNTEFYKGIIIKIIDYQIELIKTKDQDEHQIPQNN